ncbi:MAG: tetratricopeptide repeat protein [Oligoflexales bacterium]
MGLDENLLKTKVDLYANLGRYDAAEKLILNHLEDYPSSSFLYLSLGLIYHKQSRFNDAIECFTRSIEMDPSYTEASLNLVVTLSDLGLYERAQKTFEEAKKYVDSNHKIPNLILKNFSQQHLASGINYEETGFLEQATSEYRQAVMLHPQNVDARLKLAKLFLDENQIDKTYNELSEVLRTDPEHSEARTLMGLLYYKAGQVDLAKDHWRKAEQNSDRAAKTYLILSSLTDA